MIRRVRRSFCVFFSIEDQATFDLQALLRGQLETGIQSQVRALSPLTESGLTLTPGEIQALQTVPIRGWTPVDRLDLSGDRLEVLARAGIVVSDSDDPELARLRRLHDRLREDQWHPYAAFYHFMTRGAENELGQAAEGEIKSRDFLSAAAARDAAAFVERYGPPPPPFHRPAGVRASTELPRATRSGGLYEALVGRKTVRAFDTSRPLALEDLATLLGYTFGCQAYVRLAPAFLALHKTSPSGGSLHPIEAYPLVLNVEGLEPGLYHYDVRGHALSRLRELEEADARRLAVEISNGQEYTADAHALVVLTARFPRSFWKYRRRSRAYLVVHMDAGHLSQTFYLVASDLGLGAFFSGAVDAAKLEELLEVEPQAESAVAICGCGVKLEDGRPDLGLDFRPYAPGASEP